MNILSYGHHGLVSIDPSQAEDFSFEIITISKIFIFRFTMLCAIIIVVLTTLVKFFAITFIIIAQDLSLNCQLNFQVLFLSSIAFLSRELFC